MDIHQKLEDLGACKEAREWAKDKSLEEIWNTCHRGDWMLWLFKRTNPDDLKVLTLAKAKCALTIRHLMKDQRSIDACEVAVKFGEGTATREELNAAAYDADAAYAAAADAAYTAYAAAASAAYAAAASAAYDAYAAAASAAYAAAASAAYDDAAYAAAAAYAAYTAYADAAYAADASAADARKKSQQETADICRKYLPIPTI